MPAVSNTKPVRGEASGGAPPGGIERFCGCLLGLAAGDAVGTTVEFRRRGSFPAVTDMTGGGPFRLKAGEWTDDTAMALCLATSLAEQHAFDPGDQMKRYVRWYEQGYMSSNGRCFDIGATTRSALERYMSNGNPLAGSTRAESAGNGSIMRLAPAVLFAFPDHEAVRRCSAESSRTTHGAPECLDACRLLGDVLFRALEGREKSEILFGGTTSGLESGSILAIARGGYRDKTESEIQGTGYVVRSLEAALWCFWTTTGFSEAILKAANLGDDADTTAAICGQVAGAHYGELGIPRPWLDRLARRDEIRELARRLHEIPGSPP